MWVSRKDIVDNPSYKPRDAILSHRLLNAHSNKLVVIFPAWGAKGLLFKKLKGRYIKDGWAVLAYRFHDQLLEAEDEIVVESFFYIQKTVANDLERLCSKNNYNEIKFVGISLGNVAMNMVADKFNKFTEATIVVGGDDLAKDMWYGFRTYDIRKGFEKQHIGLKMLEKHWNKIAPKNHVRGFSDKIVTFLLAKNDMMVLPKYQYSLADAVKEAGGKVTVVATRFGHAVTIARFCIFGSPVN